MLGIGLNKQVFDFQAPFRQIFRFAFTCSRIQDTGFYKKKIDLSLRSHLGFTKSHWNKC